MVDGVRKWMSTGERCFGRAMILYRANANLWVKSLKATITILANTYSKHLAADHAQATIEISDRAFKNFVSIVGNKLLVAVTPMDVDRFKAQRIQQVSAVRTNMEFRSLKAAFNKAIIWGLVEKNPFAAVKQLRAPRFDPAFLTAEQFVELWRSIYNSEFKTLVVVAIMTMLRRGELLHLAWDDIDWDRRIIRVRNKKGFTVKGMRERSVPMNELVVRLLAGKVRLSEYVFTDSTGKQLNAASVSRKFKGYVVAAGLSNDIHFHSLRHTGASWMAQQSVPLLQIQKILGHSSPVVTQIYSHLSDSNLVESVDKIQIQLPA